MGRDRPVRSHPRSAVDRWIGVGANLSGATRIERRGPVFRDGRAPDARGAFTANRATASRRRGADCGRARIVIDVGVLAVRK